MLLRNILIIKKEKRKKKVIAVAERKFFCFFLKIDSRFLYWACFKIYLIIRFFLRLKQNTNESQEKNKSKKNFKLHKTWSLCLTVYDLLFV